MTLRGAGSIDALRAIEAITIFAEDLSATKTFYSDVSGLPLVFEGAVSGVFTFGNLLLNVMLVSEPPKPVEPAPVGTAGSGVRRMPAIRVADAGDIRAESVQHRLGDCAPAWCKIRKNYAPKKIS